jgi:tRNA dimethylallyltransferase
MIEKTRKKVINNPGMFKKRKVICIAGATASGKSLVAEKFVIEENGVIISADSRQVYKRIPIFSGIAENEKSNQLIGFLDEEEIYSAGDFVNHANVIMEKIWEDGKVPVIVGGTNFYFKSLLYQNFLPQVDVNPALRKSLENKSPAELMLILEKLDTNRALNIDSKNIPRIIRSIEIATVLGSVPKIVDKVRDDIEVDFHWISIDMELQNKRISKNFLNRIKKGFLDEAKNLKKYFIKQGFDDEYIQKRFFDLGLAYKHIFKLWENKITGDEFINLGILEEQKYAKRQNIYLKKFFKELPDSAQKNKDRKANKTLQSTCILSKFW